MYMYIAESNVFYCILCLCIVTVVLLLYLAIWATISLNTLHTTQMQASRWDCDQPVPLAAIVLLYVTQSDR